MFTTIYMLKSIIIVKYLQNNKMLATSPQHTIILTHTKPQGVFTSLN